MTEEASSSDSDLVVSYQGTDGAYSHIACERHFAGASGQLQCRGYASFRAMIEAVSAGAARYGMLPVENTTAGTVNEARDLLAESDLCVVGEEILRIEHCLVGLANVPVERIRRVYSHPQALAQCSAFLAALSDCVAQAFTDTAMSAKKVRDDADPAQAAIASERAAGLYGLSVLARHVANQAENFTRFMVISRTPQACAEQVPCKTSVIFSTRHERGALVRCLRILADADLNLTKLESRPRPNSPFEYLFYADFEGNLAEPRVRQALDAMRAHTNYFKLLGSYPVFKSKG